MRVDFPVVLGAATHGDRWMWVRAQVLLAYARSFCCGTALKGVCLRCVTRGQALALTHTRMVVHTAYMNVFVPLLDTAQGTGPVHAYKMLCKSPYC